MVDFVLYIDESGDPGLKHIATGGSQWFVLSGLLVRSTHVPTLGNTHEAILSQFKNRQTEYLHFKDLIPIKKLIACEELSRTPCRGFCVISDKRNILNYRNPHMGPNKDWLYWWMTRLLLERVTDYCFRQAENNKIYDPKIRIVFSRRGGNNYDEFKRYLAWLYAQSTAGGLYIDTGDLKWNLYDPAEIHIVDSKNLVGLQLADIIAGAVYNGLETGTKQHNLKYISALLPIMAKDKRPRLFGYGVKVMPHVGKIDLNEEQKKFFTICDYKGWWAPGS